MNSKHPIINRCVALLFLIAGRNMKVNVSQSECCSPELN